MLRNMRNSLSASSSLSLLMACMHVLCLTVHAMRARLPPRQCAPRPRSTRTRGLATLMRSPRNRRAFNTRDPLADFEGPSGTTHLGLGHIPRSSTDLASITVLRPRGWSVARPRAAITPAVFRSGPTTFSAMTLPSTTQLVVHMVTISDASLVRDG